MVSVSQAVSFSVGGPGSVSGQCTWDRSFSKYLGFLYQYHPTYAPYSFIYHRRCKIYGASFSSTFKTL